MKKKKIERFFNVTYTSYCLIEMVTEAGKQCKVNMAMVIIHLFIYTRRQQQNKN